MKGNQLMFSECFSKLAGHEITEIPPKLVELTLRDTNQKVKIYIDSKVVVEFYYKGREPSPEEWQRVTVRLLRGSKSYFVKENILEMILQYQRS